MYVSYPHFSILPFLFIFWSQIGIHFIQLNWKLFIIIYTVSIYKQIPLKICIKHQLVSIITLSNSLFKWIIMKYPISPRVPFHPMSCFTPVYPMKIGSWWWWWCCSCAFSISYLLCPRDSPGTGYISIQGHLLQALTLLHSSVWHTLNLS